MSYEGTLMDKGPVEGYYCHQCTWGDRAGAKRLWDFAKLLDHATSIRPHSHSGPKLMKYLNDAPYVRRTPSMGNEGVGQPAIPTEHFMVLEDKGHVGYSKISAAVMEAKPKHIRHTVLTKDRMRQLEEMPAYIQQFARELPGILGTPQSRDIKPQRTDPGTNCPTAEADTPRSRTQQMPKERQALNKDCKKSDTKCQTGDVSAMHSKKGNAGKDLLETESTHGEGNFEYRIRYDIVSTEDADMIPPTTMASGVIPQREAVAGCTTVRFRQAGVTKAFLPPGKES